MKTQTRFKAGSALGALLALGIAAPAAYAQSSGDDNEIVVTGTNIRGAAPVGQNIVQIGREAIEDTAAVSVQQLLSVAAPALNGFGSSGQGGANFEPRLRSLGGSSSAATLVLVNGRRITPGSGIANTADPNIVPAGAIERVEILPDGASALYGSDAVAGVINIITRKNYSGYEISGQTSFAEDYTSRTGNLVFGSNWDSGSLIATYGYSYASNLAAADRDRVSGNQSNSGRGATNQGGSNFNTFACFPATVVPATGQAGAGLVFETPYATGTGITNNTTTNGLCSTARYTDILPENNAHRVFMSVNQDLTEKLNIAFNMLYSNTRSISQTSRGTATNVTVFGPGSTPTGGAGQINPFFVGPPGVNRETVSVDFNELLGSGSRSIGRSQTILGSISADYELPYDWRASGWFSAGQVDATTTATGAVCSACVLLALNGTTNATGNPTQNTLANSTGTSTLVTRLPLTTANALDVWRSGSANRTSAAIINQIIDGNTFTNTRRPLNDLVLKFDGPLFNIPGGPVRAAVGAELFQLSTVTNSLSASPIGPASTSSTTTVSSSARNVRSYFAEFFIPIVGADMNVPLMQKLDLDISGRIDTYSDLSSANRVTKNPKIGLDWVVNNDLKFHTSYGTSFTAPTVGVTELFRANSTIRDYFGSNLAAFTLPAGYPNRAALGCPATGTCTITSGSGFNGIQTFGGNPDLKPMTGRTWSVGFEVRPSWLDGFHANVTAWQASFRGIITNFSNMTTAANTPGLENVLVINPTAQQIADATYGRTAVTTLPTTIHFLSNIVQSNYINVVGRGADIDIGYRFNTGVGEFQLGVAGEYKFDWEKQTAQSPWVNATNILNTTNTLSPLKFGGRASLGYRNGPVRANLFMNYVSDYYLTDGNPQFTGSPCPSNVTATGFGCQHVPSYTTFDANVSYDIDGEGLLNGLQVSANVRNIADEYSPWVNSADSISGNGSLNDYGNLLGRVVTVGLRKRW